MRREMISGYPPETGAMQYYGSAPIYLLTWFGRLNRDIICERDHQPDMVQTLQLVSGDTIQRKITPKDWSRMEGGIPCFRWWIR